MNEPRPDGVTDRIRLAGITATGRHGVLEHERRDGQPFLADVVLHVDTRPAAAQDRLDLTVHYGVLAEQVEAVLTGDPADLVETVAERIAAVALTHRAVAAVDVVVHKPRAPVTVRLTDVAVEIHRDRDRHPPAVGAPAAGGTPLDDEERLGAPVSIGELLVPPSPDRQDRLDRAPAEEVDVVLALGSNVGESRETLRRAIWELAAVEGLEVTAVAPLARTAPVGGPEQPDFLNTVVLARTGLAPRALLRVCQEIEQTLGRERHEHWGPRTLDIDLVTHGSTVAVSPDLELPHPRAHQRAFVLQPWAQLDPGAVLPGLGGGPVDVLARTAPDRDGIRWMALDWWQGPEGGS